MLLPLITVFSNAFANGVAAAWDALKEPDSISSIWLTIIVAAIAVPMNAVFGVAAAWDLFASEMFRTLHELSCVYRLQKPSQLAHREPDRPFITPAILGADAGLLGGGHAFLAH